MDNVEPDLLHRYYWQAPDGEWWRRTSWWCPVCSRPITKTALDQLGMHPWCLDKKGRKA